LKILDHVLSSLLILGGIGHTFGSLQFYKSDQMTLLWSLCASLFIFTVRSHQFYTSREAWGHCAGMGLPGRRLRLDCGVCSLRRTHRELLRFSAAGFWLAYARSLRNVCTHSRHEALSGCSHLGKCDDLVIIYGRDLEFHRSSFMAEGQIPLPAQSANQRDFSIAWNLNLCLQRPDPI
jgi:hypothetical protein